MELTVKILKTAAWSVAFIFAGTAVMTCFESISELWHPTNS